MSTLSFSSILSITPDQVSCDLAGEAVILELRSGKYFGLNEVGARVWELLKEKQSPGHIRDVLLEEYDVEPDQCERDLLDLLQQLIDRGLVHVEDN